MERHSSGAESGRLKPYLTTWGAVAFSFGCAVGWGAFIMPGTAFLPVAGPLGTLIGLGLTTLAHIPVHVVTADVELQEDYAEKGFDSIVLKPVTVGTLGPLLAGLSERKN